jgi:hypothetical protein
LGRAGAGLWAGLWAGRWCHVVVKPDPVGDELPQDALVGLDGLVGVQDVEAELVRHRQVLLQQPALEDPVALDRVGRESQVHAGLEVLQLLTPVQNPAQRHFELRLEEEDHVGHGGEAVEPAHPGRRATAHHVAGERGEDVPVAQHQVARAQQRQQLPLVAIREIRGVDEAEGGRREQVGLLAARGGALDQLRGVPLAEEDLQPELLEPALQQVDLRGLARAVNAFDSDEAARKPQLGERLHPCAVRLRTDRPLTTVFRPARPFSVHLRVVGASASVSSAPGRRGHVAAAGTAARRARPRGADIPVRPLLDAPATGLQQLAHAPAPCLRSGRRRALRPGPRRAQST